VGLVRTLVVLAGFGCSEGPDPVEPRSEAAAKVNPSDPGYSAVEAGYDYTCGLARDSNIYCWGNGEKGQLGFGTGPEGTVPGAQGVPLRVSTLGAGSDRWSSLQVGAHHACAIEAKREGSPGRLYCWGWNFYGQLGLGLGFVSDPPISNVASYGGSVIPWPVPPDGFVTSRMALGVYHTCAVRTAGSATRSNFQTYCWGNDSFGQVGAGARSAQFDAIFDPEATDGAPGTAFALGWGHSCGLNSGTAYCWGLNGYGQLGDGTNGDKNSPVAVGGGLVFTGLTAGTYHTCGVTKGRQIYCWGSNSNGQLGTAGGDRVSPTLVPSTERFISVDAGAFYTCGLTAAKSGSSVLCGGTNGVGELGNGSFGGGGPVPTRVAGTLNFQTISSGGGHTCGISHTVAASTAYCWGADARGQSGQGAYGTNRATPSRVVPPAGDIIAP
jgi:alpha-tubulin suppressor-like RCC1 family protein